MRENDCSIWLIAASSDGNVCPNVYLQKIKHPETATAITTCLGIIGRKPNRFDPFCVAILKISRMIKSTPIVMKLAVDKNSKAVGISLLFHQSRQQVGYISETSASAWAKIARSFLYFKTMRWHICRNTCLSLVSAISPLTINWSIAKINSPNSAADTVHSCQPEMASLWHQFEDYPWHE